MSYAPRTGGAYENTIGRRELLAALGGAAVAWPLAARAQPVSSGRPIVQKCCATATVWSARMGYDAMGRSNSEVIQEMSVRHRSRGDLINGKEPPCASSIHLSPRRWWPSCFPCCTRLRSRQIPQVARIPMVPPALWTPTIKSILCFPAGRA